MTSRETAHRKFRAVAEAEARGEVVDSHEYRLALLARVHAGEITLEAAQDELKRVQLSATKIGKTTRGGAWRAG